MVIRDFTDLEIYHLAEEITIEIYKLTQSFPAQEKFGLISQIRRAIISVGANIAEGYGRFHYKDKTQFLYNARGSLLETKHFLILSCELKFIKKETFEDLLKKIERLSVKLNNYIATTLKRTKTT